jgi:hypothetical protein
MIFTLVHDSETFLPLWPGNKVYIAELDASAKLYYNGSYWIDLDNDLLPLRIEGLGQYSIDKRSVTLQLLQSIHSGRGVAEYQLYW